MEPADNVSGNELKFGAANDVCQSVRQSLKLHTIQLAFHNNNIKSNNNNSNNNQRKISNWHIIFRLSVCQGVAKPCLIYYGKGVLLFLKIWNEPAHLIDAVVAVCCLFFVVVVVLAMAVAKCCQSLLYTCQSQKCQKNISPWIQLIASL